MNNKFFCILTFCFASIFLLNADDIPEKIYSPTECYTVEKKLGEGFFGNVYRVKDSKGRKYAIKSYKIHDDEFSDHPLGNAQREFDLGQTLNHPNIVKTVDLFTNTSDDPNLKNELYFLVMEYVEGDNVHNTPRKVLSHKDTMTASKNLVNVIKYALSKNLLYIDLHGGNVMLNKSQIKVIDLSSFFTFEELLSYVFHIDSQETKKGEDNKALNDKAAKVQLDPIRLERLKAYFEKNPQELAVLKAINLAVDNFDVKKGTDRSEYAQQILSYYFSIHIEQITDMLVEIHSKSNCAKDDRINLRIKLKTLAWNYQEDFEDGHYYPFDYLLDQVNRAL